MVERYSKDAPQSLPPQFKKPPEPETDIQKRSAFTSHQCTNSYKFQDFPVPSVVISLFLIFPIYFLSSSQTNHQPTVHVRDAIISRDDDGTLLHNNDDDNGTELPTKRCLLITMHTDQLSCFVSRIPSPLRPLVVKAKTTTTTTRRREEKAKQRTEPTNKNHSIGGVVGRKLVAVARWEVVEAGEEEVPEGLSCWYDVVQQELLLRQEVNLERRSIQQQHQPAKASTTTTTTTSRQGRRRRRRRQRKEAAEHNELHQKKHQRGQLRGATSGAEGGRCLRRNCSPTSSRRKC